MLYVMRIIFTDPERESVTITYADAITAIGDLALRMADNERNEEVASFQIMPAYT